MTSVNRNATLIWQALRDNPNGLSFTELMSETGLSRYRVRSGLRRIREVMQVVQGQPQTWNHTNGVYRLTASEAEFDFDILRRAKTLATLARNLARDFVAAHEAYGNPAHLAVANLLDNAANTATTVQSIVNDRVSTS